MTDATHDLAGNLEAVPLAELVQFLNASRRSGVLELQHADGRQARCTIVDGELVDAHEGRLQDREAAISMMHWRSGRFVLRALTDPVPQGSVRMSVPALVMEVARLEDELERHSADAPAPRAKLQLRDQSRIPDDPLECGARQVFDAIAAHPQIRLHELQEALPLAPIKVTLAVAWMISMGMLGSRLSQTLPTIQIDPSANQWFLRVLLAHASGMRVLVVCPASTTSDDIVQCVKRLADDLGASPSVSAAVDGPSIVRIRPKVGGLLSLTFLPLKKKHKFLFQTFARTAQLLLMPSEAESRDVTEWKADAPAEVSRLELRDLGDHDALLRAMRSYVESLDQKQVRSS